MSTVSIGSETRPLEQADPEWITQQINRRRHDGVSVCVRVKINTPTINIPFATQTCGASAGGGRPPTAREREIIELWNKLGLNDSQFSPGAVVAFVNQVSRLI